MIEVKRAAALLVGACMAMGAAAKDRALRYDALGTAPDARTALPFGVDLLSSPGTRERTVALRPDGRELFYTLLAAGPQIMQSSFRDGRWQPPVRATFSDDGFNTEPSFAPDGRTLFFVSTRPPGRGTDIWKVERSGAGWSEPIHLDGAVNGDGHEWHPQSTANGDLYFAATDRADSLGDADLYVAKRRGDAYLPARNLGSPVNTSGAEWDPYVSPSGSFLIFKTDRAGGHGGRDLWLSKRRAGAWTPPRNLGGAINTADDEDAAELTPDGRFLIFGRSKPGAEAWKLYWIDARGLVPR